MTRTSSAFPSISRRLLLKRAVATGGAVLVGAALAACGAEGTGSSGNIPTVATGGVATVTGGATRAASPVSNATGSTPVVSGPQSVPTAFSVATSAPAAATAAPVVAGSATTGTTAAAPTAMAGGGFDWMRFKGTTLRVFANVNPAHTAIQKNIPEFERLTGIKVNYEELPELQGRQKLVVEFTAGNSTIDVFTSSLHQERLLYAKNGWYLPLNEYLNNPQLVHPDFDWNDFFQGAKDIVTVNGRIVGMPELMDTNITYYRKDLLQKAGIAPPKNTDEVEAAAKMLHAPPMVYGFVARGQKTQNATQIDPYLRNFGGGYFDKDGKPILDSDGNVKAVDWYAGMLKRYGPPGVTNFSWPEASQLFQQGRVAIYTDGASFAPPFEDKAKSTVAGNMGYGIFPAGPAGNFPPLYGNSWSVYAGTKNKEAAWYFTMWATNKQNTATVQRSGVTMGRSSVWMDMSTRMGSPLPGEFFDSAFQMLRTSVPGLAPVINVAESRDIVSVGVIDVINGQDAKTVMKRVNDEFTALVNKEKA